MLNVLITGASGGIGAETARIFAEKGYNLVLHYNSGKDKAENLKSSLEKYASEFGKSVKIIAAQADLKDRTQVFNMRDIVKSKLGGIDILINNAGISQQKLFTDITEEDFDNIMDINVKGVFNCCQAFLPHMIFQKSGSIVNVSSMWGITGASCEVHYSASKAAVIGLTKSLAKETGLSGVRVNCVAPGFIDTKMNSRLSEREKQDFAEQTALNRLGCAKEAAAAIYFLASSEASYITGQVISADGGFVI